MFKLSICSKFVYANRKICDFLLYLSKDFTNLGFKHDSKRKIPRKKNKAIIQILILRKYLEKSVILRIRMLVNTSPEQTTLCIGLISTFFLYLTTAVLFNFSQHISQNFSAY